MSREQIVRDTAYAIWEAEGKPEGRAEAHWRQAEGRIAEQIAQHLDARATPPAMGEVAAGTAGRARARPPARGAAAKGAATKGGPARKS